MHPRDIALATSVAVIWGLAFIAIEYALQSFSAPILVVLRFVLAALPVFFVPRPNVSWRMVVVLGLFIFTGQFVFLFASYEAGMPPGLASVATHTQALFTIMIVALVFREVPSLRQVSAIAIAAIGLGMIGASLGGELTAIGLILTLCGALSWAIGNTILKKVDDVDMLSLMVWMSLVPPLPALAIAVLLGDGPDIGTQIAGASLTSWLALIYLGVISTAVAFAIWGRLLNTYPAVMVTPFALFAPCTGVIASWLIFDESFGTLRGSGMVLVMIGIAGVLLARKAVPNASCETVPPPSSRA